MAEELADSGIERVVWSGGEHDDWPEAEQILEDAGVTIVFYSDPVQYSVDSE